MEDASVDAAAPEEDDGLALEQRCQVVPVDTRDGSNLGRARFPVRAVTATLEGTSPA